MKKITYFFNKDGRKLSGREKLVVYTQEDNITFEYPDAVLEKTDIKDLEEPISSVKPGDVVKIVGLEYNHDVWDIVSSVDLTKGNIKLTWNNSLKFKLEDGHLVSGGRKIFIVPETESLKIEETRKKKREEDLIEEIGELENTIYNLSEEDLIKILEILKNGRKD